MGEDDREAWREGASEALAALNDALAREIGPENTGQAAEYIEHHEFGLALELIVALVIRHGLDGRPYAAGVERLFKAMGMDDSEYAAEWREHLGEA